MPVDRLKRMQRIACPCGIGKPHLVHCDTARNILNRDYLRSRLRDADALLPEFEDNLFSELSEFETWLGAAAADEQRAHVFATQFLSEDVDFISETTEIDENLVEVMSGDYPCLNHHIKDTSNPDPGDSTAAINTNCDHEIDMGELPGEAPEDDCLSSDAATDDNHCYDICLLSSYQVQRQSIIDPRYICGLGNLKFRIQTGGSEALVNHVTGNFNDLLYVMNAQQYVEPVPKNDKILAILQNMTELHLNRVHCCENSCCAFTGLYKDLKMCPYCGEARLDARKRPRKTFDWTPLTRKLRVQFADSGRSEVLQSNKSQRHGKISDVWHGEAVRRLQNDGYLLDPREVALGLATDRVQLFVNTQHVIWPLILTNFNIPPAERYRQENQMIAGLIPGPNEPRDLNSFMLPIVEELQALSAHGVKTWDGYRQENFTLRAHLIMLQGNSPALAKMVNHSGHSSFYFCLYCAQVGLWHLAIRCPLTMPVDKAGNIVAVTNRENLKPKATTTNPYVLTLRTRSDWLVKAQLAELTTTTSKAERQQLTWQCHGITGFSPLLHL